MPTAWCLTIAFLTPWVVGLPFVWLIRGCRVPRPSDWLWVPFVGLAAIICPLQNLAVFGDLPLRVTAPWFWVGVAVAWVTMLAARTGRRALKTTPLRVLVLTLVVSLGQGIGVLAQGVEGYRGNMQTDQYQYVVLAQFLVDEPFSTDWEDMGQRPWLVAPVVLKRDRLGQSIIHGFFAVTAGRDALDLYFPTHLLGIGLLVPAVFLLGNQLGLSRRVTTWAAAAAGFAPGTGLLLSLCFLSHSFCIPLLVAYLAAVVRLSRGGGWGPVFGAVISFALGFAVYTEFAPLFLGASAAALVGGLLGRFISVRRALVVSCAVLLGAGANPAAVSGAATVWARSIASGPKMTLSQPVSIWASCVWLHHEKASELTWKSKLTTARAFVLSSFGTAAIGAVWITSRAIRRGRRLSGAFACCSLLLPPLALWLVHPESVYMISKLVWTLTPLLVLLIAFVLQRLTDVLRPFGSIPAQVASGVGGFFLTMLIAQSFWQQQHLLHPEADKGPARIWKDDALRQVCAECRRYPSSALVIAIDGDGGGTTPATISAALCYHGRHHRVWLLEPAQAWAIPLEVVPADQLKDLATVPAGALVVVRRGSALPTGSKPERVFRNDGYEIVRVGEPCAAWRAQILIEVAMRRANSGARDGR